MRWFPFLFLFLCFTPSAYAHIPYIVTQDSLKDVVTIDEPEVSKAYYGILSGFPHTYLVNTKVPITLFVEVLVPDIDSSTNNVSSIITRQVENSGRVTEVARLEAKDASWESFYEFFGGDSYRRGPDFEEEIDPGTYRVEVHTPDNVEKYVLVVGKREEGGELGYFELLRRMMEVKLFFEKPRILIIESPFVFIPLLVGVAIVFGILWYRRRGLRSLTK